MDHQINLNNMNTEETEMNKNDVALPLEKVFTPEGFVSLAVIEFIMSAYKGDFDKFYSEVTRLTRDKKITPEIGQKLVNIVNTARFYFSCNCEELEGNGSDTDIDKKDEAAS